MKCEEKELKVSHNDGKINRRKRMGNLVWQKKLLCVQKFCMEPKKKQNCTTKPAVTLLPFYIHLWRTIIKKRIAPNLLYIVRFYSFWDISSTPPSRCHCFLWHQRWPALSCFSCSDLPVWMQPLAPNRETACLLQITKCLLFVASWIFPAEDQRAQK